MTTTYSYRVPAGAEAATAARRAVTDSLAERMEESLLGDVRLLVSELVTNSVVHGAVVEAEEIVVEVTTDGLVRVEVVDGGVGFARRARRADPLGGWGLILVERLADRWGVARERGTRVWFEIDLPGPSLAG